MAACYAPLDACTFRPSPAIRSKFGRRSAGKPRNRPFPALVREAGYTGGSVRFGASCLLLSVAIGLAACARTTTSEPAAGEEDAKRALTPAEIAERSTPAIVSVHTKAGLGTGFVMREDGWIVTNLHVVAGHDEVMVLLSDGT